MRREFGDGGESVAEDVFGGVVGAAGAVVDEEVVGEDVESFAGDRPSEVLAVQTHGQGAGHRHYALLPRHELLERLPVFPFHPHTVPDRRDALGGRTRPVPGQDGPPLLPGQKVLSGRLFVPGQ